MRSSGPIRIRPGLPADEFAPVAAQMAKTIPTFQGEAF